MKVSKQRRKRVREPRIGAPAVTLIVAAVLITAAAAYYLFMPFSTRDIPEAKKAEILLNISTVKQHPPVQPAIIPPAAEKSSVSDPSNYQNTDGLLRDETSVSNPKPGTGRLAIIIDDMGTSLTEARSLAAIGVPLNFSIIPGLRNFREVALFAESNGIETMIHMPMQSRGWPGQRLESNGLLVSMDDAELKKRVAGFLREIPGAVGANNHMGSEFTEHADKMLSVLEMLKSNNLYFVDSVTSTKTAGLRLAREMGIKSGRRHVFLDNEQERGYILGQLGQAVKLAKKTGSAIAICHPHPETIATLAAALPALASQGVTLVAVSQLVR